MGCGMVVCALLVSLLLITTGLLLLNQVQYRSDSIVVTRNGKPAAALVDFVLYERFLRLRRTFAAFTEKLGQTYAGVPAETVGAEINAAIHRIRRR